MTQRRHPTLLLASQSPRRTELLSKAGIPHEVVKIYVEESYPDNMEVTEVPAFLALKKATEAIKQFPDAMVLCADSVVICNYTILEKPQDKQQAIEFLQLLSGTEHNVITAFCLQSEHHKIVKSTLTKVRFNKIPPSEILRYADSPSPYDKAGAYGIQDWIGLRYVEGITGCYENVMGLSIQALIIAFDEIGYTQ